MMNNTPLLSGDHACGSCGDPQETKAGGWLPDMKQIFLLSAFPKRDYIWSTIVQQGSAFEHYVMTTKFVHWFGLSKLESLQIYGSNYVQLYG